MNLEDTQRIVSDLAARLAELEQSAQVALASRTRQVTRGTSSTGIVYLDSPVTIYQWDGLADNSAWQAVDLSAVVPADATGVLLRAETRLSSTELLIEVRSGGWELTLSRAVGGAGSGDHSVNQGLYPISAQALEWRAVSETGTHTPTFWADYIFQILGYSI